jgi:hypothetical protein
MKHEVGKYYVDGDDDPMLFARIQTQDRITFYAFINIRTGESVCVDATIEDADKYNPNHKLVNTKFFKESDNIIAENDYKDLMNILSTRPLTNIDDGDFGEI